MVVSQRQVDLCEFKVSVFYRSSFRAVRQRERERERERETETETERQRDRDRERLLLPVSR